MFYVIFKAETTKDKIYKTFPQNTNFYLRLVKDFITNFALQSVDELSGCPFRTIRVRIDGYFTLQGVSVDEEKFVVFTATDIANSQLLQAADQALFLV